MTEIKIPYRNQSVVGMNLWLTQKLKSVYRRDWWWEPPHGDGYYLYRFKHDKDAVLFALRWA